MVAVFLKLWAGMPVESRAAVLQDHVRDYLNRFSGTPGLEAAILDSLPPPARQPFTELLAALRAWCWNR